MNPSGLSLPSVDTSSFVLKLLRSLVDNYPSIVANTKNILGILVGISFPLSLFFLIVLIYTVEQLKRVRAKEATILDVKVEPAYEEVTGDTAMSKRWESGKQHIASRTPDDWRQAIL